MVTCVYYIVDCCGNKRTIKTAEVSMQAKIEEFLDERGEGTDEYGYISADIRLLDDAEDSGGFV